MPTETLSEARELSPEEMRSPLRSVTVHFSASDRDVLVAKLRDLANHYRFAIRFSTDPARPGDIFVQLYRSDIKMIGRMQAGEPRLELTIYRTLHRVPVEAVEQSVSVLQQIATELPNARFVQTVFALGDDMALEPRTGTAPVRAARVTHADGAQDAIKRQLAIFADANGYAIRFTQVTPDPKDFIVSLYSESLNIRVDKAFTNDKVDALIYLAGDRTASRTAIDQTFALLREAFEQIPGVLFAHGP
jgi:hypothetical protein